MPDLCELTDLKSWLGITNTAQDGTLGRLISAVSDDFMAETMRQDLVPATDYTDHWFSHWSTFSMRLWPQEYSMGFGVAPTHHHRMRSGLYLRHYPVNSVTSVKLDGTELAQVTNLDADNGWFFDDTRLPEDRQLIVLVGAVPTYFRHMEVAYNGGYDEIPPAIEQAIIEWAAFRKGISQLQQLDQSGGSTTIGTFTQTGDNVSMTQTALAAEIPINVQRVIDQYRRPVI